MRAVGIDLGEKRIGVAISDSSGSLATPYEVVARTGSRDQDHRRIRAIVDVSGGDVQVLEVWLHGAGEPIPLMLPSVASVPNYELVFCSGNRSTSHRKQM